MSEAEYAEWRPRSERDYAQDMIDAGIDEKAAREKAERDFPNLLPDGVATEGQDLYTVVSDGEPAGVLWLCERELDDGRTLFIYDVRLHEGQRGKGIGRATMQRAEDEARRRGIGKITLNVFGGNEVARNLYRSLGYDEVAVYMSKTV
jgi:GNAT superfamily N-acetyltransferase